MLNGCCFLEAGSRWPGEPPYRCARSVNFCSLGSERELCRTCPLSAQQKAPNCKYLDLYTFLRTDARGTPFVLVEMRCSLPSSALHQGELCAACPARQQAVLTTLAGRTAVDYVR